MYNGGGGGGGGGSGSDAEAVEIEELGDAMEVAQGGRSSLSTFGAVGLEAAAANAKRQRGGRFAGATPSSAAPLVKRQRGAFRCALVACVADAQAAFLASGGAGASTSGGVQQQGVGPSTSEGAAAAELGGEPGQVPPLAGVLTGGEWDPRFRWDAVTVEAR